MAAVLPQLPHFFIDGKWVPCLPVEEFGFLGQRYLVEYTATKGQPSKKLLLRNSTWESESGKGEITLSLRTESATRNLGQIRAVEEKNYKQAFPKGEGKFSKDSGQVYQQDISGLIPLKHALLNIVKDGQPKDIWELFNRSCAALRVFGENVGQQGRVPLQNPQSLAVNPKTNSIVLLDAEFQSPVLSDEENWDGTQKIWFEQMNKSWFGESGKEGWAPSMAASFIHSKAMLRYFRYLLGSLKDEVSPENQTKVLIVRV